MITHYVNTYFRSLFVQLDLKQDGRIDADELSSGLHKMGYSHLTQVNIQLLINALEFNWEKAGTLVLKMSYIRVMLTLCISYCHILLTAGVTAHYTLYCRLQMSGAGAQHKPGQQPARPSGRVRS